MFGINDFAVGPTPSSLSWTAIAQGVSSAERVGLQLMAYAIVTHIRVTWNNNFQAIRFLTFVDTQQVGGTTPSAASVTGQALPPINTLLSRLNFGRYRMIWSKLLTMKDTDENGQSVYFKIVRRIRRKWYYFGVADTSVEKNGVYTLMWTNDAVATTAVNFQSIIYATDA